MPVPAGTRQVDFVPVETLLCLAASLVVVEHRRFGSGSMHTAPEPVPALAALFTRKPSSVVAKMNNLDGSRSRGGRWDVLAGSLLRHDVDQLSQLYRTILQAARAEGIDAQALPDFLGIEQGGAIELLGQEELTTSALETFLAEELRKARNEHFTERETERILLGSVRVGQHVFASKVLHNCGFQCVFCGLSPPPGAKRMLLASHIKPWRDSTSTERLDHRNGLAACPTHDVAFDTGLLAVNGGLRVHLSQRLQESTATDAVAARYFGRPPIRERLLLPEGAEAPESRYLEWHRSKIYST